MSYNDPNATRQFGNEPGTFNSGYFTVDMAGHKHFDNGNVYDAFGNKVN